MAMFHEKLQIALAIPGSNEWNYSQTFQQYEGQLGRV